MPEPSPATLLPRGRAAAYTAGLALATWGVFAGDPGPGTHGRGLVILVAFLVAAAAWLTWAWAPRAEPWSLVVMAAFATAGGLLTAAAPNAPSSAFAFVAVVSTGIRYGALRGVAVLALTIAALTAGTIAYDQEATGAIAYSAGLTAALLIGLNRRESLLRAEETELRLAQVQRSREEQLRAAALDERARIAREIHDVLAHSLAGLTIDLEATRTLLEAGADPATVLPRVERAHALAREGLVETRRAIGALRGDAVAAGTQLAALAAAGGDGTPVELTADGDLDDLPGDVALAVVRVAQEALTNARKHAPGAAVRIAARRTAEAVELTVTNDAPAAGAEAPGGLAASGGGYGLQGMRERAEIADGTLEAGPSGDGGWSVALRLPLPAVAA